MRRRFSPAVIGLSALAVVVVALAVILVGSPAPAATPGRTVAVSRGVVQETVSGSGNLAPVRSKDVSFQTTGTVTSVSVTAGQHVSKGEVLAKLDDAGQQVDLAKAEEDLEQAEAGKSTGSSSAAATTTAAATATPQMLAVAARVSPTPSATPFARPSPTATPRATATATPTATPDPAAIEAAELSVKQAQDALAATVLRAPIDGTVADISGAKGDTIGQSSSAFLTVVNVHRYKIQVSLSESDIGKVKRGQPATVTVNAISGLELSGHVTKVGLLSSSSASSDTGAQSGASTSSSSAVSYPVTITMDQGSSRARAGMSASADVVVGQQSGLSVPNQALRGSTVTVDRNGAHTATRVETGLAGDDATIVTSGVSAGEQLWVQSTSAAAGAAATGSTSAQTQSGVGNRTGGGGFRAGGFGGGGFAGGGAPGGGP